MRNKTQIGLLVAAAAFAMQAQAHGGLNQSMSDGSTAPEMLTVFEPDGASSNVSNVSADWTGPETLTVFDTDGSIYSVTPIDLEVAYLEPTEVAMDDQALPDQLTVFEPNGDVHSYMFTPDEPTLIVAPLDIVAMDDDFSAPLVAFSDDFNTPSTYVANYISPPTYTGILDQ